MFSSFIAQDMDEMQETPCDEYQAARLAMFMRNTVYLTREIRDLHIKVVGSAQLATPNILRTSCYSTSTSSIKHTVANLRKSVDDESLVLEY